jgi:DNA modification methylase
MSSLARHSMPGSLHYHFTDWRHLPEFLSAGLKTYTELKNLCVWSKHNAGMGSFYRSQHELVLVFKRGRAAHCNNVQLGRHGRSRSNVWNYASANNFGRNHGEDGDLLALHPTVKPVAMIADAIMDCTRRGDLVLDGFLGSGTALIACEKVGRRCFGIEIEPRYVDLCIKRWQLFTATTRVFC